AWGPSLGPVGPREEWLVEQMAGASVRIDRCRTEEQALRSRSAHRAEVCWDDDQQLLVEEIGARLARDPSRVQQRLRQTVQGCEWLFARWEALGRIAESVGTWDEGQRSLAFDLLGVPPELRTADARLADDGDAPALAALARAEMEALVRTTEAGLVDLDE